MVASNYNNVPIPDYLEKTYWWAYVRPWAVRLFERDWLINLILWGWYAPLRDLVLAMMGEAVSGKTLKISCCYGALEPMLAKRVQVGGGTLDIIDVAPEQLKNARRKIPKGLEDSVVTLHHQDACDLQFADNFFDQALLFFLPHEQPEDIRRKTFAEAFRVVRPNGHIYIAEFHRCALWHPLKYIWHTALYVLEPYAPTIWKKELTTWMPNEAEGCFIEKRILFGGFYQIMKVTLPEGF